MVATETQAAKVLPVSDQPQGAMMFAQEQISVSVTPLSGSNAKWQVEKRTVRTCGGRTTQTFETLGKFAARSVAERFAETARSTHHATT